MFSYKTPQPLTLGRVTLLKLLAAAFFAWQSDKVSSFFIPKLCLRIIYFGSRAQNSVWTTLSVMEVSFISDMQCCLHWAQCWEDREEQFLCPAHLDERCPVLALWPFTNPTYASHSLSPSLSRFLIFPH